MGPQLTTSIQAERLAEALNHIETAANEGAQLALLPEAFASADVVNYDFPNDDLTIALGEAAKKHNMYIAFGVFLPNESNDIYQSLTDSNGNDIGQNNAVILDRETGNVLTKYVASEP